jgi:ribosome-associated protein
MTQAHVSLAAAHAAQGSQPIGSMAAETPQAQPGSLHALVLHQLDEDQAQELVSIPLEGKSSIADHMVIASGRSTRQVAAMAQKLAERIKREARVNPRIEGLPAADWVLIDAGDVVVHLFRPEVRSFYNLERMWGFGDTPVAAAGRA